MTTQDWPLVLYQIFVQGSVGVFLTLGALLLLSRYRGEYVREYTRIALVGCCLVACLVGAALVISWFHVSQMLRVFSSAPNLGSSWLAREVVFTVAFLGMVIITGALLLARRVPLYVRLGWGGLTGLVGLMTIVSMSMVYMLNARPAWNNPATMMTFLTTTMLLGVLTAGVLAGGYSLTAGRRVPALAGLLSRDYTALGMWAMVALIVQGVNVGALVSYLSTGPQPARDALDILTSTYGGWFWVRLIVGIAAPLLLTAAIWWTKGKETTAQAPTFVPRVAPIGLGALAAAVEVPAYRWM
ncbi:MAG TPA: DmsC/YnfH family molybdoenzyme membrane anchor subunit, partial [Dehalococcoidia bacterium]|nr:DmsC/YnfH family molybdoenzyme membrane anchor subunit [Dehalococcoidia bacterium]